MTSISDTNVVNAPGGLVELGYLELGASSTIINAGANSYIGGTLTCICDGSPVLVECMLPRVDVNPGGDFYANFEVDGVSYGRVGNIYNPGTQTDAQAMHLQQRITPLAGSRTFRIRGYSTNQTTTVIQGTGANSSAIIQPFLRVSKIIQASQLIVQTPNAPLVTSLPSNAIDGQEVRYLADDTNGIVWNFRYRAGSSSAYKWEFIGGAPLVTQVDTDEGIVAGTTTYTALATAGPSITLALAGDYVISQGCRGYPFANNQSLHMSYDIGATPASDSDSVLLDCASGFGENGSRTKLKTGISANSAIVSKYKHTSSGAAANFAYRWMTVTPVRVSA